MDVDLQVRQIYSKVRYMFHVSEHQICNRSDIHGLNSVEKINRSSILHQQHKMSAIFCINVHVLLDMDCHWGMIYQLKPTTTTSGLKLYMVGHSQSEI